MYTNGLTVRWDGIIQSFCKLTISKQIRHLTIIQKFKLGYNESNEKLFEQCGILSRYSHSYVFAHKIIRFNYDNANS
jgi:hypothetical protein